MKTALLLSFAFLFTIEAHSQFLKKLGKELGNEAKWKVRTKADQKVDQAIDTIIAQPKKLITKKDTSAQKNAASEQPQQDNLHQDNSMQTSVNNSNDDDSKGYVTLGLSAYEVFSNGTVTISGNSLKYGNFTEVKLNITGPSNQTLSAPLNESNAYSKEFKPTAPGNYIVTAISSNNKTKQTATLKVLEIGMMDWGKNIEATDKAMDRLKTEITRAEQSISSKDKAQLDKKIDELEERVTLAKKLFTDLGDATKQLKGIPISEGVVKNLSALNNVLTEQRLGMEKMNEIKHEPYDNTICEYLVMVNEACAAFQTFTNFYAKTVSGIVKNIIIDKGVPTAIEVANNNTINAGPVSSGGTKVIAKYFATVEFDADQLATKIGKAGMAADVIQFICDVLLKTYCGVFTGEVTETYTETFRNSSNSVWWKYSYETKAAITFRYPKSQTGKVIKMKGNIEGNATKFSIYQNPEQMDEFEKARGKTKLIPTQIHAPLAVPFATSQYDYLGFGAVARGIATPAYFNIPVDAEYNTDDNTIKLMLNQAIVDFTPLVTYKYAYIAIAAGIPLFTVIDFPINKARATLNSVVSKNNELHVTKDAKNNLNIKGGGTRQIGEASSAIEHTINYTLTAKNDN